MMAPQIRPHTPYFTFAAVTGVIAPIPPVTCRWPDTCEPAAMRSTHAVSLPALLSLAAADRMTDYDDVSETMHLHGLGLRQSTSSGYWDEHAVGAVSGLSDHPIVIVLYWPS